MVSGLKVIICTSAIKTNLVMIQDITLAEKTIGPDSGSLDGKRTCTKPMPVVHSCVDILKSIYQIHVNIILCMDAMKVNGLSFLTMVLRKLYSYLSEICKDGSL